MKALTKISSQYLLLALTSSFVGFVVLSWWLLFRDQRALEGFEAVYPIFNGSLLDLRHFLLEYSLNVVPTVVFAILGIISFGAYLLLLHKKFAVRTVVSWALFFQMLVFVSYPVLSTDIFSYAFSQRVFSEYGQNIWLVPPNTNSSDVFEQFADWKDKTNVYGLVNQAIYFPATHLGGDDVFTTIVLYKLTVAVFAVASVFLLVAVLQEKSEKEKSFYVKLIFWNPLFVLEILGSGHNDMLLIFFLLASVLFWKNKQFTWAGLMLGLAVQVKLIPIIFFGFFAVSLLQRGSVRGLEKKTSDLLKYAVSFLVVNSIAFVLMGVSPITFLQRVFYNTQSYWQSLPGLVARFFPESTVPFTLIFGIIVLLVIYLQVKKSWDPLFSSAIALLLYLFFFAAAYWNWYVLWVLSVVPFIQNKVVKNAIILFTFTSFLAYPLLWFSHRFGFGNSIWPILTYLWIFGVPIGFLGYNYSKLQKDT